MAETATIADMADLVFKKLDALVSEPQINNFIENTLSNHSYMRSSFRPIDEYRFIASEIQNQFINKEIESAKVEFFNSLKPFLRLLSYEFWSHGPARDDHDAYMCLRPEWNIDRGGHYSPDTDKKYDEIVHTMLEQAETVENKYITFRKLVKCELAY